MNTIVHVAVVDCLQRLPDYARSCWHRNSFGFKLSLVDTACNVGQIMLVGIGTLKYKAKINTNSF